MSPIESSTPSWAGLLRGRGGINTLVLAGATALHAINVYVVTTVLPSIVAEIGGLAYYAWNTSLFVIASIVGAALAGPLAARRGGRYAYLLALACFALGSLICALAPSMAWLLAGRAVQGGGGGMLVSLAYVLIRQLFEPAYWPRAMGLVSAMWGVATLAGPALGGVFAQAQAWRMAFWSLFPVILALALLVAICLPKGTLDTTRSGQAESAPWSRLLLLALSVLAISLASLADAWLAQAACVLAGLALAALMVLLDRRATRRLLPADAYRASRLRAIYLIMSLLVIGSTTEIYVPYLLQRVHGHSPLVAGYLTAVMAAGWSFGSTLSASRSGSFARRAIALAPVLMAVSLAALAWLLRQSHGFADGAGLVVLCMALVGVGSGIGLAWPHLLSGVLEAAPAAQGELASASISTVQLYAMALGAAAAGLLANAAGLTVPGGVAGARAAAGWLFGGFAVLVACVTPLARRAAA